MSTPGAGELVRLLHELRAAAGLSTRAVGDRLGWSAAKVSRVEAGKSGLSPSDAAALATLYGADPDTAARLEHLAGEVRAWTRRVYLTRGNDKSQQRFAEVERSASVVRTYSPLVLPGLLHTRDYARVIFTAHDAKPRTAEQLAAAIELRMRRQADLGADGREYTMITTEGALGVMAESPDVMLDQLDHVAQLDLPGVRFGIIPWGTRARVFPLNGWDLYDQRAVALGTVTASALLTHPAEVERYAETFEQLERMAVFGGRARELVERSAQRYRGPAGVSG